MRAIIARILPSCGDRIRTYDLRVMRTTTVFTARMRSITVCGLDCLFTLDLTLGYLPFSLYTFTNRSWSLARDYPTSGFPEFDR